MGKLIKLNITPQWIKKGQNVLAQLSDEEAQAVIGCVMNIVLDDIKMGLAGDESGPVFESVNKLYQEDVSQCYFCNRGIDPNEVEFNLDRHLCLFCMLKVTNLLTAFDLPAHKFFPGVGPRTIQKTKLVRYKNYKESLDKIEHEIRLLIHSALFDKASEYWERCVPENTKLKVSERVKNEVTRHPYERGDFELPENKLKFCDVRDYAKIIKFNWDTFGELFMSKTELDKHFDNLAEYRNKDKHGRTINSVTRKEGEAAIDWFENILSQIDHVSGSYA